MREKSLHLWASLSLALGLLLASSAVAQEKPKPPASPPQPSTKPNTDKPSNPPAKNADQPKSEQPKSEQPSKPAEKQTDKPADKPKDNATEKSQDRTAPRNTDRNDTDRSNTDRNTDRSNTDRNDSDRKNTADTSNRGGKQNKEVKPADLGFTFEESDGDKGLKLSKLASESIGSKADFKEGDILISVNDNRLRSQKDFLHWIHAGRHDRITVIVLRDDREVTLYLDPEVIFETTTVSSGAWLGVDLNDRFATAAVVLKVHPNSPAQRAGLRGEDVILAVDGQRVKSADHLGEVIGRLEPEQKVEIRIERNKQDELVSATLGRRENVSRSTSTLPRR